MKLNLTREQKKTLNKGVEYQDEDDKAQEAEVAGPVVFDFVNEDKAFPVLATNLRIEKMGDDNFVVYDDVLAHRSRQTKVSEVMEGGKFMSEDYGVVTMRPPSSTDWKDFHYDYRGTADEIVMSAYDKFDIPGDAEDDIGVQDA